MSDRSAPARFASACAAALIGWALGYGLPVYGHFSSLWYDPQRRAWLLGPRPGPVPMGYYGQLLWALGGAALGLLVFVLIDRLGVRRSPRPSASLPTAWALTALLLVGAWFSWNNWP